MKINLTTKDDTYVIQKHKENIINETLKESVNNIFSNNEFFGGQFDIQHSRGVFSRIGFDKISHERNIQN